MLKCSPKASLLAAGRSKYTTHTMVDGRRVVPPDVGSRREVMTTWWRVVDRDGVDLAATRP